jgi:GDP-L-fucose synthase
MTKKIKCLITGGNGLVGSYFKDSFFIKPSRKEFDLCNENDVFRMFKKYQPDYVIHLAARVGGIKANSDFIGEFYYDNIKMNTNILECARYFEVKKLISLLSTCVFPHKSPYPLLESEIHNGEPHFTNFGYAYAKRMLDVQSRSYRQQFGCNFITAIPNNLYGKRDNFNLENSHVIPAIIRKIWEAKLTEKDTVEFWGDGSALREFTYAKDIKNIILFLLEKYNSEEPINIGNTVEYSIAYTVKKIAEILDYKGRITWNGQLNGQLRKPSSNEKLIKLGWNPDSYTPIDEGLKKTCSWFIKNYPNKIKL